MKKLLLLFIVSASLIACTNQKQEGVTVSNGFAETKGEQVTMGSQESVDIFLKIDKAWKERDYDAFKSLVSKDAEFVNEKGEVFVGPQAFTDYIEKYYQESLAKKQEWEWTINYAFCIKPTNADRGEFVNARITGTSGVFEEWYQIADGKLISWEQAKRALTAE